ncbi:DUF4386 family protein [Nonomuraea sp. NPDC049714]|uniref:DUF4386 family protein n=1 Tax=Nonomuraea sp. NPDC049714 TaxID=3364357 RepID=UPI00379008F1
MNSSGTMRGPALVAGLSLFAMAVLENLVTFFGLHLLLLGYLAYRWARVVGVLLGIAGLGYLVDSFGAVLGHTPDAAVFTFVGEVVLMLWLLVKGRNITPSSMAMAA